MPPDPRGIGPAHPIQHRRKRQQTPTLVGVLGDRRKTPQLVGRRPLPQPFVTVLFDILVFDVAL